MKRRHLLQGSALTILSLLTPHYAIGQSQMTATKKLMKVRVS